MFTTTGIFATANGSKYLQQLCKHFAHKIDVSYEETWGCACFPFGKAILSADDSALSVRLETEEAEVLDKGRSVIDSHLERFAFREAFTTMTWGAVEQADPADCCAETACGCVEKAE